MSAIATQQAAGRRRQRINAWLTALLVILVLVQGNRLAREHLSVVRDITEDQLFLPSQVGQDMLGALEDTLQVKAYFTGDVQAGSIQIAKRRLIDQLEEFAAVAGGRMQISYGDPNSSKEARSEAEALGILPEPYRVQLGVSNVSQNIWLGMVLRYRGKESVLKWVLPQFMESKFLLALRKVTREALPTVGIITGDGRNLDPRFAQMRADLQAQYKLHEVLGLAQGQPISPVVEVLLVVQPTNFHPRVAYAIDQYIQAGGHALMLLDGVHVDMGSQSVYPIPTGLEQLFAAWGVELGAGLIWDQAAHYGFNTKASEGQAAEFVDYPFFPHVTGEQLNRELPATASIAEVRLGWTQELEQKAIPGLQAQDLLWSSEQAWSLPYSEPGIYDRIALKKIPQRISAAGARQRLVGLSLSGFFPSPHVAGVPAPIDPIQQALHDGRVERALEAGEQPPALEVGRTDELARSAEIASQVILIGDADWVGQRFFRESNRVFFANLIDWLAQEDDLMSLRSRIPIERPIADFLAEERAAIGLEGNPEDVDELERITIAKYENRAAELAANRRWTMMLKASAGALLSAFLLGLLWRVSLGRSPRAAGAPAEGEES